jgi:hypothetical protein
MWINLSEEYITSIFKVEKDLSKKPACMRWLGRMSHQLGYEWYRIWRIRGICQLWQSIVSLMMDCDLREAMWVHTHTCAHTHTSQTHKHTNTHLTVQTSPSPLVHYLLGSGLTSPLVYQLPLPKPAFSHSSALPHTHIMSDWLLHILTQCLLPIGSCGGPGDAE